MSAKNQLDNYENYVESNRPNVGQKPEASLDCAGGCSRVTLIIMNLFFLCLGAAIVGVAAYSMNTSTDKITSRQLPIAALVLGAVVIFISFLGCCGAKANSRCGLLIYALILIVIIIVQVVIASIILADSSKANKWLTNGWKDSENDVRVDVQNQFKCCGLETFNDTYAGAPCPTNLVESVPCLDKLKDEIKSRLNILGAIGLAFGLFQLFGVVFACCLKSSIEKQQKEEAETADIKKVNRTYA